MQDVAYALMLDQAAERDRLVQMGGGEPTHAENMHRVLGLEFGGLPASDDRDMAASGATNVIELAEFVERANQVVR